MRPEPLRECCGESGTSPHRARQDQIANAAALLEHGARARAHADGQRSHLFQTQSDHCCQGVGPLAKAPTETCGQRHDVFQPAAQLDAEAIITQGCPETFCCEQFLLESDELGGWR